MTSPPTRPDLEAIRRTLIDDVADCWIASKEAGAQQVDRRNYVRAVFAMIDGFLAVLKAYVIDEWDGGRFNPSRAEAAALLEETYDRCGGRSSPAAVPSMEE